MWAATVDKIIEIEIIIKSLYQLQDIWGQFLRGCNWKIWEAQSLQRRMGLNVDLKKKKKCNSSS